MSNKICPTCHQPIPHKKEDEIIPKDVIAKVKGEAFRCDCGCNVFRWNKGKTFLRCNSCLVDYLAKLCYAE